MNGLLEAPEERVRARSQEPEVYQAGDCWRFHYAGEDHGSFDSEQGALSAALRYKRLSMRHLATIRERN